LLITFSLSAALAFNSLRNTQVVNESSRETEVALNEAKQALLGYSTGVNLQSGSSQRPGDLPCPDRYQPGSPNEGQATTPCPNPADRLGRLPWKTLGLPDLRDSSGERLWYAVSANFVNNPRTPCAANNNGCLNSDSMGTISLFDNTNTLIQDGSVQDTAAIAVIIAPGEVLQRQDQSAPQNRSTGSPTIDPKNYLDIAFGEDNADFSDGTHLYNAWNGMPGSGVRNGFIQGIVRDASGAPVVNDQMVSISYGELMPRLERRVGQEVVHCLKTYASGAANKGRYPWAASVANSAQGLYNDPLNYYSDTLSTRFGRAPRQLDDTDDTTMSSVWINPAPAVACTIRAASTNPWFNNWSSLVFYAVADAYKPVGPPVLAPSCGICITMNTVGTSKQAIVIVAGKKLAGQNRIDPISGPITIANQSIITNYLEGENAIPNDLFGPNNPVNPYNDLVFVLP
jgi:hypothetical protein